MGIEILYGEGNSFLYWANYSGKAEQKYLVPVGQAQRTNQGRTLPIHPSFNSLQGPTLSSLSDYDMNCSLIYNYLHQSTVLQLLTFSLLCVEGDLESEGRISP